MNINIGWPEGIFLVLTAITLALRYSVIGKPRPADQWWAPLFDAVVGLGLLYWGGFFS